jgi:hypothetical protein
MYKNIYRIIILPVVVYGRETCPLTVREGHRLRVFKNRALRTIFEPKRDEVTGGWRKLHNEEPHNLYSSPSIVRMFKSRRMRWAMHVRYWWENQKERDHWEDLDVGGWIILKLILEMMGWYGLD